MIPALLILRFYPGDPAVTLSVEQVGAPVVYPLEDPITLVPYSIQSPRSGARITSPLTVSGVTYTSDPFTIRLSAVGGEVLAQTVITPNPIDEKGLRIEWGSALTFGSASSSAGVLEVFQTDAGGAPKNRLLVPVEFGNVSPTVVPSSSP